MLELEVKKCIVSNLSAGLVAVNFGLGVTGTHPTKILTSPTPSAIVSC